MSNYNFSKYLSLGFSVIPLRGKIPLYSWKRYQQEKLSDLQAADLDLTKHNIGIVTGKISGIVVVDIDGEYPPNWPEMPPTWCVKTARGYHYYFNLPDRDLGNKAGIAPNVDIRAEGGYVVAPPSIHPDSGLEYTWISPPDGELADFPDFILPEKQKERTSVNIASYQNNDRYIQAAIDGEVSALSNTGEGGRNHQLNKSAFALAGLIPPSQVEGILKPIALSIGLGQKEIEKTLQSAIRSAKPREIPQVEIPEEDCPMVKKIIRDHKQERVYFEVAPDVIDQAPGMVGQLAKWINDTSLYPQPVLALAASIPAIGNVMAHRVATETNLRTNFYTLGIAESGAGKEHARRCISRLYEFSHMSATLLGDPASAVAVVNSVKRSGGRGLMMIDEFGRYLESMRGKNAAAHVKMITTNMMYMFNAAGDTFTGQEYANNDLAGGRSDIDQPCLGIYATTVPSRFYSSLSDQDTFDGFLSRWLIFETKRFDIEPELSNRPCPPPEGLCDEIRWWHGQAPPTVTHKPKVIEFENVEHYYAYIRDCRTKMATRSSLVEKAFWNRAAEHAAKLALVAHTGQAIDSATLDWAIHLTNALTQSTINNVSENMTNSAYEGDLKRLLCVIKEAGTISRNELTRRTQWLERRKRGDILDNLLEAGRVGIVESDSGPKNKKLTSYEYLG